MTAKQLEKIDTRLDVKINIDKILINKRGYFIYYNEPNKLKKEIKIHIYTCGFCTWGSSRDIDKEVGRNGVWIGPFKTPEQAEKFALDNINHNKISVHTCI
jgi:hypothetical protein